MSYYLSELPQNDYEQCFVLICQRNERRLYSTCELICQHIITVETSWLCQPEQCIPRLQEAHPVITLRRGHGPDPGSFSTVAVQTATYLTNTPRIRVRGDATPRETSPDLNPSIAEVLS